MTLDGWPFLGTLIALAALTTAGTVWFLPRLARQAPGPIGMRRVIAARSALFASVFRSHSHQDSSYHRIAGQDDVSEIAR